HGTVRRQRELADVQVRALRYGIDADPCTDVFVVQPHPLSVARCRSVGRLHRQPDREQAAHFARPGLGRPAAWRKQRQRFNLGERCTERPHEGRYETVVDEYTGQYRTIQPPVDESVLSWRSIVNAPEIDPSARCAVGLEPRLEVEGIPLHALVLTAADEGSTAHRQTAAEGNLGNR